MCDITLYGALRCTKTRFYIEFFKNKNLEINFYDVEEKGEYAEQLRNLYENRKLNFPTIMIKDKKLRNPSLKELEKWLLMKGFIIKSV